LYAKPSAGWTGFQARNYIALMLTFKHSGDLGDIIYSLPTIRALGGGTLLLDPRGGHGDPLCMNDGRPATRLSKERIDLLRPLLQQQEYIREVDYWTGQAVDHNLDLFRDHLERDNICDAHLEAFKLPFSERERPWLTVPDPIPFEGARNIAIHRSVRYLGNFNFWYSIMPRIAEQSFFVGLAKEHEIFEYSMEIKVPYRATADFLELARVIAGARRFLGNASFPHALAQAMYHREIIVEIYRAAPCNVVFNRKGVRYV
jgi:hypothetical protein